MLRLKLEQLQTHVSRINKNRTLKKNHQQIFIIIFLVSVPVNNTNINEDSEDLRISVANFNPQTEEPDENHPYDKVKSNHGYSKIKKKGTNTFWLVQFKKYIHFFKLNSFLTLNS